MFKTIRQAAYQTEIPEYYIRRLVAAGECPGVRSGNRFLVNVEALVEMMDTKSREAVQ